MKNIVLVYPAGYHGEFFIGNIVSNTDKFHYHSFECRNKELNAYRYDSIIDNNGMFLIAEKQTADDLNHYSKLHNKPIITRTHNHRKTFDFPVIRLFSKDPIYSKRAILLKCIKTLDKGYNHINGIPDPAPDEITFKTWPVDFKHSTDSYMFVDIKDWLHNKNLEKVEDFLGIEYTQTMKDEVTQYYERDEKLLDKYFSNWQNQSIKQLVEQMAEIDKKYRFFG